MSKAASIGIVMQAGFWAVTASLAYSVAASYSHSKCASLLLLFVAPLISMLILGAGFSLFVVAYGLFHPEVRVTRLYFVSANMLTFAVGLYAALRSWSLGAPEADCL